ncbi:hypothetical protein E2562_038640 [Oryza meyeriana var. granulata]|uniref:Uncharacterized protein n=1 Tax=Oryza meyeriana var. granulata TaxID=110450 RepID=A0A6G1DVR1_9ORYZ|nr:hypothetical protein E2562_038640 [Oryza meyeriana var. granulata]
MVTRDVIFDEKKAWNWAADGATPVETTAPLTVDYPGTVGGPTIAPSDAQAPESVQGEPSSPEPQHSPAGGGSPATPQYPTEDPEVPELTPSPFQVQQATPPSEGAEDSEGVPLRFRTIPDLLDTTEEMSPLG